MENKIIEALRGFAVGGSLRSNATALLRSIGYSGERDARTTPVSEFLELLTTGRSFTERQLALFNEWRSVEFICQITPDDINTQFDLTMSREFNVKRTESMIFMAVELESSQYPRSYFAGIARIINRSFPMPVVMIFHHREFLTISVIHRRESKLDENQDVLENVTLIKDIRLRDPHRAQVEIIADLSLETSLSGGVRDLDGLHDYWESILGIEQLNQRFYRELFEWYQTAAQQCNFPDDRAGHGSNERHVIRMITRLLFIWFLKEKCLVPESLFDSDFAKRHLLQHGPDRTDYYRAVLQNLFFATLNTEISERAFVDAVDQDCERSRFESNLYRYRSLMKHPEELYDILQAVPFVNGGLFDSLDRVTRESAIDYIDAFVEFDDVNKDSDLHVPERLFFDASIGLFPLLSRYKFTIEENTPVEQEVALDPELLGRVFENLLAAYNPETRTTIRKSTGSYYTPRQIVEYLVDESIIAVLSQTCAPSDGDTNRWNIRLRRLLEYRYPFEQSQDNFDESETASIVHAIATMRILDPAVGSGAFPMSVLQKLTLVLRRIDAKNHHWERVQELVAGRSASAAFGIDSEVQRNAILIDISKTFSVYRESDYGRKLFLIQNGLFGVDIQPIACQITKLRFFITLIVEQQPTSNRSDNYGIRPLPNLETRFVSANTLIPLRGPQQRHLGNEVISGILACLKLMRERYFNARDKSVKSELRVEDAELRRMLSRELKSLQFGDEVASALVSWDPYDQNTSATWFGAEWMFGIEEGFDIVIGNPPYVRADLDSVENKRLRVQLLGSGLYDTLEKKWDLYLAFMERSFRLCRPDGVSSLIVSDAFCNAPYANRARKWYAENVSIERLDFFPTLRLFDASVHNISYLFRQRLCPEHVPLRQVHVDEFGNTQSLPSGPQSSVGTHLFSVGYEPTLQLERAFMGTDRAYSLGDLCYISVGMVCNAHEREARHSFRMQDVVSDSRDSIHPKPFVEGKHLSRWLPHTVKWLEWGTFRAPILFRRRAFVELFDQDQKIITQRSPGPDPKSCYDDTGLYHNESVISIVRWCQLRGVRNRSIMKRARYAFENRSAEYPRREALEERSLFYDHKLILACINSSFISDYLSKHRRSRIHIYPDDWRDIPIPKCSVSQRDAIVSTVRELLASIRSEDIFGASQIDNDLARMVDELYQSTFR